MATEGEEKKSFFGKMIDMVSTRDEKEAVEEAQKELEEAQKETEQAKAQVAKATAASSATQREAKKKVEEAEKRASEAEARAEMLEAELRRKKLAEARIASIKRKEAREEREQAEKGPKIITEHTLTSKETLSHLSLKYYNHATKPYWMVIYDANKDVIGDNPNRVRAGLVIKIPELPEDMKD